MSKLIHYSSPAGSILLPQGYTRLAYIESTGTLWIDTGWNPSNNTQVQILIRFLSIINNHFFGSRAIATAGGGYAIGVINNKLVSDFNGSRVNFYTPRANELINILKKGVNTKINGTSLDNTNSTFSVSYSLYLLALNESGKKFITQLYALLYNCRIWEGDIIKRDFVPVQTTAAVTSADGTSCPSGSIGLLDLVENKFYLNKGTGTFIAGPECPQGFPTSEYCLVEWLESTGTLYILTDYYPTNNMQLQARACRMGDINDYLQLFGCRGGGATVGLFLRRKNDTNCAYDFNSRGSFSKSVFPNDTFVDIDINKNVCKVNGTLVVSVTTSTFTTTTYPFLLFVHNNIGKPVDFLRGRVSRIKITDRSIQHDYISCYRRSDMKPGLYDIVGRKFYTNQGTGEFLLGPSITFGWGEVVNNVGAEAHPMLGTLYTETNKFTHTGHTKDSYKTLPVYQRVEPGQLISISFDTDVTLWASHHDTSGGTTNKGKWSMWIYFNKVYDPNNYNLGYVVCYAASLIKSLGGTRWKYSFTVPADMHMIRVRTNLYSDGSTSYTAHFWNFNWSFGDTGCQVNPLHAIPHNISTGDGRNGEKNGAFHFDGTSYMEVDAGSILPANCTKYTIMMWTKVDTSGVCALFSQRNLINDGGRCVLYDNTKMYYDDGVRSHFSHGVTRNNWNHYAFVHNGSNKYVYVNGQLVNTSSASTAGVFSPVLTIGACLIIDSGVRYLFVGDMKDIKVFDTALTLAQIQQEM